MHQEFDFSSLNRPYDHAAASELSRTWPLDQPHAGREKFFDIFIGLTCLLVVAVLSPFIIGIFVVALSRLATGEAQDFGYSLVISGFAIPAVMGMRWTLGRYFTSRTPLEQWWRLHNFASENQLQFTPWTTPVVYPSALFSTGKNRATYDLLRPLSNSDWEIGNLHYETGFNRSRIHRWGFVCVRLDRTLPHMFLAGKRANTAGRARLPISINRSQKLSLEGDFDSYFTLYCPEGYERDALYVFTPELMASLVDETVAFDVEVIDDWLFVFSREPLVIANETVLKRLVRIVSIVGSEARDNTESYVDDRASAQWPVAQSGRRLRATLTWGGSVVIGICLATLAFQALGFWLQAAA